MMNYRQTTNDYNTIIDLLKGPLFSFLIICFVIMFILSLVILIGRIILFKKSGQKWWKAIIPFYGTYVFIVEISGLHWSFFLLRETMFFGLYSGILIIMVEAMAYYNLAKKCHQDKIVTSIFGSIFSGIVTAVYGYNPNIMYDPKVKVNKCSFFEKIIK